MDKKKSEKWNFRGITKGVSLLFRHFLAKTLDRDEFLSSFPPFPTSLNCGKGGKNVGNIEIEWAGEEEVGKKSTLNRGQNSFLGKRTTRKNFHSEKLMMVEIKFQSFRYD